MTDFNPKSNAPTNFRKKRKKLWRILIENQMRPQIFAKTKKIMTDFNPKSNASTNFRKTQKNLWRILIQNQMRPQIFVKPKKMYDGF